MIYDYQDIETKLYITHMSREWATTGKNAAIIIQNPRVKEITGADLSAASTDDVVWTILYLIGVGLLRYMVTNQCQKFDIALNPHWEPPRWINNQISKNRLNMHIDFMMENERRTRDDGIPLTPLIASLEMITYHGFCKRPPKEPNQDPERELLIIRRNRQLRKAKLQFHSIR